MPAGQKSAQISISILVFNQTNSPCIGFRIGDLGAYDGFDSFTPACR